MALLCIYVTASHRSLSYQFTSAAPSGMVAAACQGRPASSASYMTSFALNQSHPIQLPIYYGPLQSQIGLEALRSVESLILSSDR
jgi:hypothetical protein